MPSLQNLLNRKLGSREKAMWRKRRLGRRVRWSSGEGLGRNSEVRGWGGRVRMGEGVEKVGRKSEVAQWN